MDLLACLAQSQSLRHLPSTQPVATSVQPSTAKSFLVHCERLRPLHTQMGTLIDLNLGKHNAEETFVRLRARPAWQEALASLAPRHVFYISTAVPLKARRPCIHRNTFWSDQTKKSFLWIRGGVGFKTCPAFCRKHAQGLMWHVSPQSTGV